MIRLFIVSILLSFLGSMYPLEAVAQELRRVFKHRRVWVENISACPTTMTDKLIDYFQNEGQKVRLINVNPFTEEPGRDCKQDALFLVHLKDRSQKFKFPGYSRFVERNGTFVPHSAGEVQDLEFNLKETDLRVVEVIKGSMFMTKLNTHEVELQSGTRLRKHEVRAIISEIHSAYQPSYDRPIVSAVGLQKEEDDSVIATFENNQGKQERYRLAQINGLWTIVEASYTRGKEQTPLPGG